ncbi:MAG TPA: tRNA uridine-5-carboxymethylaminomethyl(34) synthesis GTPase MnmE [Terriglobia bacterium]|nr:tRNA uridine-5-carboxymethylaminomethyl(34) synthesis GTPase MnmE [Terriglobia bacterium]
MPSDDTIVAIATPPGRGGIGIVRLSGEHAIEIVSELVRFPKLPLETQRATLGEFIEPESGRALDRVVATCFRRPHSYTGEDVVEVSCHGAPVILQHFVECCLARPLAAHRAALQDSGGPQEKVRTAEPGEFTMRAFLNGRMDLTQAEAIRDLIDSRTLYQARVAAEQMEGALSRRLQPHKRALVELIAGLEAGIDFAEDDVPVSSWTEIASSLDVIQADLGKLVEGYEYGRIVREGLTLAIVGRPNVGKSSLFNRLLNEERAIVTSIPGTTRDLVSESASIGGIPLRFVDTAGIRDTADEVEAMGVGKSLQAIADSDLRLLVADAADGWTEGDSKLFERIRPLGALLIACNKSDLAFTPLRLCGSMDVPMAWTSALTGEGIPELKDKILEVAAPAHALASEGGFITNLRHQQLIKESLASLARARSAAERRVPHEMLLLDLYDALHALDTLTGATTVDDLLGVIFSTFCVGK